MENSCSSKALRAAALSVASRRMPTESSTISRQRIAIPMFLALVLQSPSTNALSTVVRTLSTPYSTTTARPTPTNRVSWTDHFLDDFDDDADDLPGDFEDDLFDVLALQSMIGSEVVERSLQQQIDSASKSPNVFLDNYVRDASMLEKVAMSSLPQQLPKPAVAALKSTSKAKTKIAQHSLNFSSRRITPDQELLLANKIQQGVALHNVKVEFENKHGREITKREWMELAELESPKDLRRLVSQYRQSKQLLVSANMGLVHAIVKSQYSGNTQASGIGTEEMVQEGSLGLMRAAELFDPSRGLRFSTYATIWIKGILCNSHVKETITVPLRERAKWNKMRTAHKELAAELGREPTHEEVASRCQMNLEEFRIVSRKMTQTKSLLSLDYEYNSQSRSGDDSDPGGTMQNDKHLMEDADLAERTQLHADVVATLARNLDAREARLMRLRYGLVDGQTRSIQECADSMGLSKTRVQQLAASCLKKLREASEAEALQEYLLTIA